MIELILLLPIVVASYLIGRLPLALLIRTHHTSSEHILLSISLGLGSISLAVFAISTMRYLSLSLIIMMFLFFMALLLNLLHKGSMQYQWVDCHFRFRSNSSISKVALIVAISYGLYQLANGMTPVINNDSLSAYLNVPKLYLSFGGIYSIDWLKWDDLPLNIQMINLFGMLVYSDILAQLLSGWLMGVLSSLAVYVIARNFVSRRIALFSAVVFFTIPTLSWLMYSAKIDLGYTMFELCFWGLFIKWIKIKDNRELFFSAVFLGLAIGSKYHALFALVFSSVIVAVDLLVNRVGIRKVFFTLVFFCLIALVVGSPSYIKNFIYTGDPFYPFLTVPDTGAEEGINQYVGLLDYFRFQYNMFMNRDFLLTPRPMMCEPIGFIPLMFLPFVPFGVKQINRESHTRKIVLILLLYYLFLSFIIYKSVFPYPRHFLPAIGLLIATSSIGIKYLWESINKKVVMLVLLISLISITAISNMELLSYKSKMKTWKLQAAYLTGSISKDEYYDRGLLSTGILPNRGIINYVKTMPEDTRIATLDYGTGYFLDRPLVKRLYYYTVTDIDSMKAALRKDRITHIYYSKDILEEYVMRWNNGDHSLIYDYIRSRDTEPEFVSSGQYLYRFDY